MPTEYLIWWLCEKDVEAIGETLPQRLPIPRYIHLQYQSRSGRPGNGRLWSTTGMPESVKWRKTSMSRRLMDYGGIVINAEDFNLLADLPGIITNFRLQRPMMV